MLKGFLAILILFSFSFTVISCSLETLVSGKSCVADTICSGQDSQHPESADSDHSHHCHACTHIAFVPLKPVGIVIVEHFVNQIERYSFHYKNPSLETRKRPPLAA